MCFTRVAGNYSSETDGGRKKLRGPEVTEFVRKHLESHTERSQIWFTGLHIKPNKPGIPYDFLGSPVRNRIVDYSATP